MYLGNQNSHDDSFHPPKNCYRGGYRSLVFGKSRYSVEAIALALEALNPI